MRVLVVGGGINGLCTAWALTRAGHRVTVLDANAIPNTVGTSYDEHRLTRLPYGDQAGYVRMMADGIAAWDLLWTDLGARHVAEVGCFALCTGEGDWTDRSARTLDALGIAWERLEGAALAARMPMLRTGDALYGLAMPQGGALFADRIVDGLVGWLKAHGAELRAGTAVGHVHRDEPVVTTRDGESIAAEAVVVTAGAWARELFPELASEYVPLRQVVAYVQPPVSLADEWRRAPVMLDLGVPRGMYLAPPVEGRGFKIGVGAHNRPCELDACEPPTLAEGELLLGYYRERFQRWDEFRVLSVRSCVYANEAAQRFILRRHGAAWVLTGCSGHGFKFGALMGLAMAEAALGGRDFAALSRWVAGEAEGPRTSDQAA